VQVVKAAGSSAFASIHGYELPGSGSYDDLEDFVEFDSPRWNSLVTVDVAAASPSNPVELEILDITSPPGSTRAGADDDDDVGGGSDVPPLVRILDSRHMHGARPTVVPDSWKDAVDSILQDYCHYATNIDAPFPGSDKHVQGAVSTHLDDPTFVGPVNSFHSFRIALAGAKSTGKSTCLRYLVNRMLSRLKHGDAACAATAPPRHVFVLDADCGQPELGPPGVVTLTRVSAPMLKPPHTQTVQLSQQALFYGHVTSSVDPTRYIDCIRHLLMAFESMDHDVAETRTLPVLVINLDGWVKSVGEQILQALLEILTPSHVIQLTGDTKSQQFSLGYLDLERTRVHAAFSFNSKQEPSRGPVVRSLISNGAASPAAKLVDSVTMSRVAPPPPLSMSAAALRSIRICSYFLRDDTLWDRVGIHPLKGIVDRQAEIANRLAASKPYRVHFDAIEWNGCFASPDHARSIRSEQSMLDVLNASLVGLCCRAANEISGELRQENHLLPCVGLGLVRAIHREARLFYILTPVPFDRLRTVNCLVRGSVEVPVECTYRGVHSDSFPYQSFEPNCGGGSGSAGSPILGDKPMHSRGNIVRLSLLAKDSM
jgi:polynucleotide 5'-hydroxyl-kinase GRC3/NOL9